MSREAKGDLNSTDEADVARLLVGEVDPTSAEGHGILKRAGLTLDEFLELQCVADSMDFESTFSEAQQLRDAPGAALVHETLRALVAESSTPKVVPRRWLPLAAAALFLGGAVFFALPRDGGAVGGDPPTAAEQGQQILGSAESTSRDGGPLVFDGRLLQLPFVDLEGELLELNFEGRNQAGPWINALTKRSESLTVELGEEGFAKLVGFETLRLRGYVISAEGTRAPLYSRPVPVSLE